MITPPFEVKQDEEFIYISMKIKYIKVSECDFYINENLFKFYCKPYFLRLCFENPLIEDGRENASYDLEKGEMFVKVSKKNRGEFFENLDMVSLLLGIPTKVVTHSLDNNVEDLTHIKASDPDQDEEEDELEAAEARLFKKLLVNDSVHNVPKNKPLIEIINETNTAEENLNEDIVMEGQETTTLQSNSANSPVLNISSMQPEPIKTNKIEVLDDQNESSELNADEEGDEMDFDWSIPQQVPPSFSELDSSVPQVKYGFLDRYHGFFDTAQMEMTDIIDNPDPDRLTIDERREARVQNENSSFNFDHYIADFMDSSYIDYLIQYNAQWEIEYSKLKKLEQEQNEKNNGEEPTKTELMTRLDEIAVPWTDYHRDVLIRLPKREYIVDNEHEVMFGLVDLMFSFAYNNRTTEGENNVESSWNLVKLSATLSWFDKYSSLKEVLISCARRSLVFPLYRNWKLVQKLFSDVYCLFYLGKRALLRSLIEMKQICDVSESKHYLSRLYLEDYCVWIQRVSKKKFLSLASEIERTMKSITKEDLGFPLTQLEELAMEEE